MSEKVKNTVQNGTRKMSRAKRPASARRRQIFSILAIVFGIFCLVSIASYSQRDEQVLDRLSFFDIFSLPFDDQVKAIAGGIQNRIGPVGAFIAHFFINLTIGYSSIIFPVLMILWGWIALSRRDSSRSITFTNYALILGLLSATVFGIVTLAFEVLSKEWSGAMGAYAAETTTRMLGTVGAFIFVLTALVVTAILAIDLDLHTSVERAERVWNWLKVWMLRRWEAFAAARREQVATAADGMAYKNERSMEVEDEDFSEVVVINKREELSTAVAKPPVIVASGNGGSNVKIDTPRPMFDARRDEDDESSFGDPDGDSGFKIIGKVPASKPSIVEDPAPPADIPQPIENEDEEIDYVFPSVELLDSPRQTENIDEEELKANAELVRSKLAHFGVEIESVSVTPGPVITMYELVPASGVKISRIVSLADDLALALAAKGIRIIAPIPGKSAVGVEIPNRNPSMVYVRSILNSNKFRESKANLPLALGKTIAGDVMADDLSKMPHLLIAGATGSGKSVGINTILASLLYRLHPSDVKFIIIDPKKIELTPYGRLRSHFLAVSPDLNEDIITTPENAVSILKSVELEMEKRYDKLAAAGVRNIQDYNDRLKAGRLKNTETIVHRKIPFLIVVIDELADLMITAAREVEEPIARLAQLARAVGIHLVLATQRPSVDVITGVIKANFPARIAYQVASKTDSRTILDMNGAEQLLGTGDMLYLPSGSPKPVRIQNAYISSEEVERLTDHIARQQGYSKPFQLPSIFTKKKAGLRGASDDRDEFFEEAARLIVRHQQGSVSLLQRRLKVGYSRAARLVDELEAAGVVGPFDGSKARLVLIDSEDQLERLLEALDSQ